MATWMTHFRIADFILNQGLEVSKPDFIVGHIGPDCGLPDENTGHFQPPKVATHFIVDGHIRPDLFKEAYFPLGIQFLNRQEARDSFLLGYYMHLFTDVEWSKLHQKKKNEPAWKAILGTPEYSSTIKTDWYGSDFLYLQDRSNNGFNREFLKVKDFPDHLDLFPQGQIQKQIDRITNFYMTHSFQADWGETFEFRYLTPLETEDFITETAGRILESIQSVQS